MSDSFHRAKYRRLPLLDRLRRGGGEARRNELEAAEAIEKRNAVIGQLIDALTARKADGVDCVDCIITRARKLREESP